VASQITRVLAMSIDAPRWRALNICQSGKKMMPALPHALEMPARNASIGRSDQCIVTL
jgi:hypothetical protein